MGRTPGTHLISPKKSYPGHPSIMKMIAGLFLTDQIDLLTKQIDVLTERMNMLDKMIEMEIQNGKQIIGASGQQLEIRAQIKELHKQLKRAEFGAKLKKWGGAVQSTLGRMCIYSALLDDIDLATEGYGSLEFLFE